MGGPIADNDWRRIGGAVVAHEQHVLLGLPRDRGTYLLGAAGGGGGVRSIRGIIASSSADFTALVNYQAWDAGFSITDVPGDLNGGFGPPLQVVEVCDPKGCLLNEPPEELFGRQCDCEWRVPAQADAFTGTQYPPFPPRWEIVTLCCKAPICNFLT